MTTYHLRRSFLTALILLLTLQAARAAAQESQPPCQGDEQRQFDFWVGDWVVTTPDGKRAGENRIEKILNDCVLLESWRGVEGSIGKSFNMYYERQSEWRQTWVDGRGGRLDLAGRFENGSMTLSGEMPGPEGGTVRHEISWTALEDGTVRQHWRASRDRGETWRDVFIGIYKRR
jgi:hypothetical protein